MPRTSKSAWHLIRRTLIFKARLGVAVAAVTAQKEPPPLLHLAASSRTFATMLRPMNQDKRRPRRLGRGALYGFYIRPRRNCRPQGLRLLCVRRPLRPTPREARFVSRGLASRELRIARVLRSRAQVKEEKDERGWGRTAGKSGRLHRSHRRWRARLADAAALGPRAEVSGRRCDL